MEQQGAEVRLSSLINPHERQREFFRAVDEHPFTLYGGARGGGKSYILRWTVIRKLLQLTQRGIYPCEAAIFCNTYPELETRQIEPCRRELPAWLGKMTENRFRMAPEYGGHLIRFLNLDNEEKYKSAQFVIAAVEELTLCPNRGILDTIRGCLRWPGVEDVRLIAATNPDGPGHSWVKRLFVSKDFSHPDDSRFNPEHFAFVRALPTDNPHLPRSYIEENLEGLPESLRKPWLEGSWDLFEGQRFEFNPRYHVVQPLPLSALEPAKWYRSIDYGFDNPYACGWYGVTRTEQGKKKIYKVHEDVRSGLKAAEQIERVKRITDELGLTGRIEQTFLDTACWKEEDEGLSIANKFIQGGIPVSQALKDRAAGWVSLEQLLYYERIDGSYDLKREPTMAFFDNCILTCQQITDAVWDPKKPGDILHPEGFRDDALDETRYFALTHTQSPKVSEPEDWAALQKKTWAAMSRRR